MRDDTWKAMEDIFSRHPILRAEGVAAKEVEAAEAEIGMRLSDDYKQFIGRYGGAIVGAFPVFGLRRAAPMADNDGSFVDVTRAFRCQRWPGIEGWAIISVDHAGNPVGIDNEGRVWISDHDARAVQLLADTFEGYVRKWCLSLPD
jgi:cell wall assembly regulator SMI1